MKKGLVAIALTGLVSISYGLTFEEAVEQAIQNNYSLKAEKQNIEIAKYQVRIDKNLYFPEFFASFSYTLLKDQIDMDVPPNPPAMPIPFRFKQMDKKFKNIDIGFNVAIYSAGIIPNKIKISKIDLKASSQNFNEQKNKIVAEVKKAYLDVLQAKAVVEIYQKQLEAVESHVEMVKGFLEEGLVTQVDFLQAKVKLAEVKRDLRTAQGKLKLTKSRLLTIMGKSPDGVVHVQNVLIDIPENIELKKLEKLAIKHRAILKYLNLQKKKIERFADIQKADFYPKVYAQAKYMYTNQNSYMDPKSNYAFIVGMKLSFRGVEPIEKQRKAKAQEKQLIYKIEDVKSKILLDVKNSYENFETAKENLQVALSSLDEAQEYYTLVVEQFKNQLASTTDVLNAEAALTAAKNGKAISYYQYLKAFIDLERAVGTKIKKEVK